MSSEHGSYGRHPAPGMWAGLPGSTAMGSPEQPPGCEAAPARTGHPVHDPGSPPYAWHGPHGTDPAGHEAEPLALHEYLLLLGGHTTQATSSPPAGTGTVPQPAGPPPAPDTADRPLTVGRGQELTAAEADALIASSSLGTPGVADIAARTSEEDAADVMQRLHALRQPPAEPPPAEYAFERWIEKSHNLPHALMRMGHSYARQHFNHRADLCFRAAMAAGHPDAEQALAALPRTREGLIEPGRDPGGHRTDEARSPAGTHDVRLEDDAMPSAFADSPGSAAQPARGLGWASGMQAI
ncbi:hypothetical protein NMG29_39935 [Streptomyces cocklensis]|uniref:Uncharacterized protein n=1 Tax=Actinacidiphila cocklensis TaxID=887465 RepID=A0A9W4E340_9ACTN|nr:hypothetical protein [Actinacidiphila cocklensis]MDD1064234.1 hypothetical protein [Actinacidiphila cocklensis]CAG6391817.1 hypothetical protein SCOCK_140015 [Actinacidiphila cocklensis]